MTTTTTIAAAAAAAAAEMIASGPQGVFSADSFFRSIHNLTTPTFAMHAFTHRQSKSATDRSGLS